MIARAKRQRRVLLALLFLLIPVFMTGCGADATMDSETPPTDEKEEEEEREIPKADDYPDASVYYEKDILTTTFEESPSGEPMFVEEAEQSYYILRNPGSKVLADGHQDGLYELEQLDVTVTPPNGTPRPMSIENSIDMMMFPRFANYRETRVKVLELGDLPIGTKVDIKKRVRRFDVRLFGSDQWFNPPAKESRFKVRAPKGWEIGWKAFDKNGSEWAPTESTEGGYTVWTWEQQNTEQLTDEELSPSPDPRVANAHVYLSKWQEGGTTVQGWQTVEELSRGAYEMIMERRGQEPGPEVKALATEAMQMAPSSSQRDVAAAMYAWVRENVSYCQIYFGLDGWIPHDSENIASNLYGDCKDKAFLLHQMLKTQGIESQLVKVHLHDGYPQEFLLPTVAGNSNHQILRVKVDGEWVYVDPTTRSVPFGEVPEGEKGAPVIPMSPEGSQLDRIPWGSPEDSTTSVELSLDLVGGNVVGDASVSLAGSFAHHARSLVFNHTAAKHPEVLERFLRLVEEADFRSVTVSTYETQLYPSPVEFTGKVSIPTPFITAPGKAITTARSLLYQDAPLFARTERTTPIVLGEPRQYEHTARISLPANWTLVDAVDIQHDSVAGRYSLTWEQDGDELVMRRKYVFAEPLVEIEKSEEAIEFFQNIRRAETKRIVLRTTKSQVQTSNAESASDDVKSGTAVTGEEN